MSRFSTVAALGIAGVAGLVWWQRREDEAAAPQTDTQPDTSDDVSGDLTNQSEQVNPNDKRPDIKPDANGNYTREQWCLKFGAGSGWDVCEQYIGDAYRKD